MLSELDAQPGADCKALCQALVLNQSTVSRLLKRLTRGGYLKTLPAEEDGRKLTIALTSKARDTMREIDAGADALLARFASGFSGAEIKRLQDYFQRFADGFGHPPAVKRKHENPFRAEQRRIARCLRVLETQRGGKEAFTVSEHHVLRFLRDFNRLVSPSRIAAALSMQRSALSITLQRLRIQEYTETTLNERDGRGELVSISPPGLRALELFELRFEKEVERAIEGLSNRDSEDFVRLLERFTSGTSEHGAQFAKRFKVIRLNSEPGRAAARIFYLKHLAASGDFAEVPERLFDARSKSFALYDGERIAAVLQLADKGQCAEIFASDLHPNDSPFEQIFLERLSKGMS